MQSKVDSPEAIKSPLPVDSDKMLGQYIPIHYHYQMLEDEARMVGFQSALDYILPKGAKVLELGAGTGVLSFFAAQRAARVYCVERQPELVARARALLAENGCADIVEVIQGDAMTYLPPEPVDVVVCEMLHSVLLREKQLEIIESFKKRYTEKFGPKLPTFVPDATILGVEPVNADFTFQGYKATISLFESSSAPSARFLPLGEVIPFCILEYEKEYSSKMSFDGILKVGANGNFNALRFITKSILAMNLESGETIDWYNQNLILPIKTPMDAKAGDQFLVSFSYEAGAEIPALEESIDVTKI